MTRHGDDREPPDAESLERVLIMGAAGRDFHNFNTRYRADASVRSTCGCCSEPRAVGSAVGLIGVLAPSGL